MMEPNNQRLSGRMRWAIMAMITVFVFGGAALYAIQAYQRFQERNSGASAAAVVEHLADGERILFRNTASGSGYGMVGSVALSDPLGPRELGDISCDRVDAAAGLVSCMRTLRGIPTTFETQVLNSSGRVVDSWPLPGVPSRTRVSEGGLVATTAFVTGHSYAGDAFSTETTVKSEDGRDFGNLESFTMFVGGQKLSSVDKNVWGVAFAGGDRFYATVASGGKTWLMEGSFARRTLTAIQENAECPSVSPDGKRVAYKKRKAGIAAVHWDIAVLDLERHQELIIPLKNGFDDQLVWFDNETLLFGAPRIGAIGDSDVYRVRAETGAKPLLFIEHAWSPAVEH